MTPPTLKPGWKIVKFGDVVALNRDRVADPAADGIERYVGLEHITPEDLRIRSWGLVAEGTTFTNYFQPGQVLFGKRRAYQRKVAVADFDGVCSGDIYVLEPKDPAVLLPELLPFICQTEKFFDHAVVTSAGSMSPRTNWTQLKKYELVLPPPNEQQNIVDILEAVSNYKSTIADLQSSTLNLIPAYRKRLSRELSTENSSSLQWDTFRLGDVLEMERDQVSVDDKMIYQEIGVRSFGRGVFLKEPVIGESLGNKRVFWIKPGRLIVNIVFAWEGAIAITKENTVGKIGSHRFPMYVATSENYDLNYIRNYLLSPSGLIKILQASPGGAGRNRTLGQKAFLDITIPFPSIEKQKDIVRHIEELENAEQRVSAQLMGALKLMRYSINTILSR